MAVGNMLEAKGIKQKVADAYYEALAYSEAVPYYVELAKSKKASAEILRKTADCFNKMGDTEKAEKWYRRLHKRGWALPTDSYKYFLLLRKLGLYKKSLTVMNIYLEQGGKLTDFVRHLQKNPNYIALLQKRNSGKYLIKKLDFNSPEHDFSPTFYENGIVFASPERRTDRIDTRRKFAWDGTNFLQLYQVEYKGDVYAEPKLFSLTKKDKYHDGPIAFNKDFTEAYLTRSNYSSKGKLGKNKRGVVEVNLYKSKKDDKGNWSALIPFKYNSSEYSTGCATLSQKEDIMIFASDMSGGLGQTDLWMTKKVDGEWQNPIHLGDKINTTLRDNYPYLDSEGDLYFASEGQNNGLGGYDIFWVPGFLKGKRDIYNMGAPINSEADDFGLVYDIRKGGGFFNSGRKGVVGGKGRDDIFAFEILKSKLEVQIIDKKSKMPIISARGCVQSEFGDFIEESIKLNDEAKFYYDLAPNRYIICAKAEGYQGAQKTISIPKGKLFTTVVELERKLPPAKTPTLPCPEVTLEDIFYDFDKYLIRDDASASLDNLLEFLKEYPRIKINLVSHTDSRGTAQYNQWLSQKRAESALNYLVERGLDRNRITASGVGESQLLNNCSNCSEREHQANRRTTVEIISNNCVEVNKKLNKYLEK